MITKEQIASILVQGLIDKLRKTGKELEWWYAFSDPCVRKQKRVGWYAWIDTTDKTEIAFCVDAHLDHIKIQNLNKDTITSYELEVLELIHEYMELFRRFPLINFMSNEEYKQYYRGIMRV